MHHFETFHLNFISSFSYLLQTVKKLNKKPLKNSTFKLKSNRVEMFQKHFLIVVVLPGCQDSIQD